MSFCDRPEVFYVRLFCGEGYVDNFSNIYKLHLYHIYGRAFLICIRSLDLMWKVLCSVLNLGRRKKREGENHLVVFLTLFFYCCSLVSSLIVRKKSMIPMANIIWLRPANPEIAELAALVSDRFRTWVIPRMVSMVTVESKPML